MNGWLFIPVVFCYGLGAASGAEGFGSQTRGGTGGRKIVVNSLADSGPGSLREAVSAQGPREITFAVAGEIRLTRALAIREPFLTLDGSTAPAPGITLLDDSVYVNTHDVILRYLRVHAGDKGKTKKPDVHAFSIAHARNLVIDHCSAYWGIDETIGMYQGQDITIQWSIIAEGLFHSLHDKGPHSMGVLLGGDQTDRVSLHHCLIVSNNQRNPRLQNGVADVRNNLIYNWGSAGGYFTGKLQVNFVGNLYIPGPDSNRKKRPILISPEVEMYMGDNTMQDGSSDVRDWDLVQTGKGEASRKSAIPFPAPAVTTISLSKVYEEVLRDVGAVKPERSANDERVIRGVRNRKGKIIDTPEQAQ